MVLGVGGPRNAVDVVAARHQDDDSASTSLRVTVLLCHYEAQACSGDVDPRCVRARGGRAHTAAGRGLEEEGASVRFSTSTPPRRVVGEGGGVIGAFFHFPPGGDSQNSELVEAGPAYEC